MRNVLFLCALLLTTVTTMNAQEETPVNTDVPVSEVSNAENVLNMPSKWDKLKEDRKITLLFGAVERGDVELAQTMLPDVNLPYYQKAKGGETLLTLAIEMGHYEMVAWLCEDAVINLKNDDGETPLTLAIKKKNQGIVNLVLDRAKADLPNNADETPIMLAINHSYEPSFVQRLLDQGANPNRKSNGITPLSQAIARENVHLAAMLVRNKANPSQPNDDGEIPLYQAVKSNHAILAGVLLHRSQQPAADADWTTPSGETLVNMAVAQENTPLLRVLADKGADVNRTDYLENTALHLAAERGMTEAVDILLASGAYVDALNIMGTTPIMAAAQNQHQGIAERLAAAGADPNLHNYAGVAANDFGNYSDPFIQQEVDFLMEENVD